MDEVSTHLFLSREEKEGKKTLFFIELPYGSLCVKLKAFYNFHLTKILASHLTYLSQITNTLIPFDSTNQLHTSHTWHAYTA